jgi:SAM-dependent methyltransferase
MERIPEPELMLDEEQASCYACADFDEPHGRCVDLFSEFFLGIPLQGAILDLGCGPGDISFRFARAYPRCVVHGIDGSPAMLAASDIIRPRYLDVADRVTFIEGCLPDICLPRRRYDAVVSNSLLHHLHEPALLWDAIRRFTSPGAPIYVMDLMRPGSLEDAAWLVELYAKHEPDLLRKDFHNSLLAAFEADEVRAQLKNSGLGHLTVTAVSDRHLVVSGYARS